LRGDKLSSTFARKDIVGKQQKNGDYILSAKDLRMLNDSIRNLWFKTYGNLETTDIKDGAITVKKLSSPVQIDISTAKTDAGYSRTQVDIQAGQIAAKVEQGVYDSYVQQTAQQLAAKVSNDTFASYQIQTADAIASKVESVDYNGDTIASLINQTYKSIDEIALNINLSGYVTFNSLSTPGATTIDGGNITADTIRVSALEAYNSNVLKLSNGCSMDFTDDETGTAVARLRRSTTDYCAMQTDAFVVYVNGSQVFGAGDGGVFGVDSSGSTHWRWQRT
jgi:hypothetical protein